MRSATPLLVVMLFLAACGPRAVGPVTEPHVSPSGPEPEEHAQEMAAMREMAPLPDPTDPVLLEGKQVFDQICSACHTMEPPPNLAPPMRMVSMHLRQRFTTERDAVGHIVAYLPSPDAEQSVMPAHAIERFGLMTPQPLPTETLEKVARYVWSLGDTGGQRRMRMRHRGGGGL